MAHYDFFNFGTSVCSVADANQKQFKWFPDLITNYMISYNTSDWNKYFQDSLLENNATKLRTAIRWTYRSQLGSLLGYHYNLSSLYEGTKLSVETPLLEYLHSIHPEAESLSVQNWDITVFDLAWSVKCYLYKNYNSLFSSYSYSVTFDKDTGIGTVIFNNSDATEIKIEANKTILTKKSYTRYVYNQNYWWEHYSNHNAQTFKQVVIYYDSIYSMQTDVFRMDYVKDTQYATFEAASSTVIYATYSYTVKTDTGIETRYGALIHPVNQDTPEKLKEVVINDARINASSTVVPAPCLPLKNYGNYINGNSQIAKLSSKYLYKAFNSKKIYSDLLNAVQRNGNDFNVKHQYILTGVSLSHPSPAAKKYWFTFANFIYEKWRDARGYSDADIYDHWEGYYNYLYRLYGYLSWYDASNAMQRGMAWTGIWKHQAEGVAFSGAKVGDYYIAPSYDIGTPCPSYNKIQNQSSSSDKDDDENKDQYTRTAVYSRCTGVSFRYQNTDKTFIEIIMYGLIYINPVGFFGYGVDPRGILHNYSLSCQNIGTKGGSSTGNVVYQANEIVQVKVPASAAGSATTSNPNSPGHHTHYTTKEELKTFPVYGALYDPIQGSGSQLLGLLFQSAGSVYIGIQNIYHNLVCNVQLGHKFEIKVESADDESGFIIPFDLVNMGRMGIFKLNDLMRSGLYVVSEYFKWDRVHFKRWKKWVGYILAAIIIIIAIIVSIWCPPAGAGLGGWGGAIGAAAGAVVGAIVVAICKLVIAMVIAIVVKVIAKALFGDTFIGMVFQTVATVVCMYYCGCLGGGALSTGLSVATVALNNYSEYEQTKIEKIQTETNMVNIKAEKAQQDYKSHLDLVTKKLLALSNPKSNFNVNVFINGLLLNQSKPCIDGIMPIANWNDSLLSWTSTFHDTFISDQIDVSQYTQLSLT